MHYTVEEAKSWYEKNKEEIIESSSEKDLMLAIEKVAQVGVMGAWLSEKLRDMGADDDTIDDACFALGQRGLFGDSFENAVRYANEYAENGSLSEKGGWKLSQKILEEL